MATIIAENIEDGSLPRSAQWMIDAIEDRHVSMSQWRGNPLSTPEQLQAKLELLELSRQELVQEVQPNIVIPKGMDIETTWLDTVDSDSDEIVVPEINSSPTLDAINTSTPVVNRIISQGDDCFIITDHDTFSRICEELPTYLEALSDITK